jgi:hypothetical protein
MVLVVVEVELDEVVVDFALAMGSELGEVGELLPGAEIEGELEVLDFRTLGQDMENALHARGVSREAADVGVFSGLLGGGELDLLFFAGIEEAGGQPDLRVLGEEVALKGFVGLFEHPEHELFNIGARETEDDVVRHVVWVFEGEFDPRARGNPELGLVELHLGGEGFEGDQDGLFREDGQSRSGNKDRGEEGERMELHDQEILGVGKALGVRTGGRDRTV